MIEFRCKNCDQKLNVKDEHIGKRVKCPKCGIVGVVPDDSTTIKFHCKNCGKGIRVPQIYAGKKGKCPKCKNIVIIPGFESLSAVDSHTDSPRRPPPAPASMVSFQCPMCDDKMQAPGSARGKLLECPNCGSFAEVPGKNEITTDPGRQEVRSTGIVACPSCEKKLADDATVCINCGIYVGSGRPILTARGVDEDDLYTRSHKVIRAISWIAPIGVYPVYSEAMGKHKPYTTWTIAAVTIVISIVYLGFELSGSAKMRSLKNLMLWAGKAQPDKERIEGFYEHTNYGDKQAFLAQREALKDIVPSDELNRAALYELKPEQQCFGRFRLTQLISHAFLHGGLFHLVGNMLFLMVLGSRVNSVIGNIPMIILYPVLAVAAALTHFLSVTSQPPTPMLGASGAVMGLAGVYLLLFPIHRIYLTAWTRWGWPVGFHLSFRFFALRGFWVVLFYIMFDVIAVSLVVETGTAHWAHIGGFMWGIVICVILLVSRLGYSRSDVISLVLGKYAWPLIGSPYDHQEQEA
jgi:membrane associated rhomboid family serine protease/DNA-directed RNA polymerase subunit RPC12/RpoP